MAAKQRSRARMRKLSPVVARDAEKERAAEDRRQRRAALKVARAERIRTLKERRPNPTWQEIGDYCGVSARAAQAWQEKGSIGSQNARRLAELWGVDYDWLYWGTEDVETTPIATQITEMQRTLDRLEEYLLPPDAVRRLRGQVEARGTRRPGPSPEDGPEDEAETKR